MEVLGWAITELAKMILAPVVKCIKHHKSVEEYMDDLRRKAEELDCRKEDIESRCRAELLPGKTLKKEVELWLAKVDRINGDVHAIEKEVKKVNYLTRSCKGKHVFKMIEEVKEVYLNGSFLDSLVVDADLLSEVPLPAQPITGGNTAKIKMEEIWECLMNEDVRKIGVYGMGGSGKTTTVKHLYNRLLQKTDKFDNLIWVTVSKDVDVVKLQRSIARNLKLDLSDVEDETKRSGMLFQTLEQMKRYVLILDDIWEDFEFEAIGIPQPTPANGCKLVLTTRSLEVCRKMDCKDIKMELLSEQEAWELFLDKVGRHILCIPGIEAIARQVAKECACLPLAIVTVARSLKGANDTFEWSNALEDLRSSRSRHYEMETQVLERLKFSYNRLKNDRLRESILYCALYPEDFMIEREELIEHLITEGIIEELDSRQARFNKGHTMLTKLENACLLESAKDLFGQNLVKMHDLIRDMALQIMSVSPQSMVKAGMHLREIPDEKEWKEDLQRVSLMDNDIEEISSCNSPKCFNLLTLLLCKNPHLQRIEDSFFLQLRELKVLDLSKTSIEKLPDSISDLENLTALFMRYCQKLKCIPSLAKLKALRNLDLQETGLEEVPQGIEMLADLRYLDLNAKGITEMPLGILPRLFHLQVLLLNSAIRVEEVMSLRYLETLMCQYYSLSDFNRYVSFQAGHPGSSSVSNYNLSVGRQSNYVTVFLSGKRAFLRKCKVSREGEDPLVLPQDVEDLEIRDCHDIRSLCYVSSLQNVTKLRGIRIYRCRGIECVLCLTSICNTILESVETLHLEFLPNLRVLLSEDGTVVPPPLVRPKVPTFSHLVKFSITGCPNIKKLFPPALLLHLQNLEEIVVWRCQNLEEIIEEAEEDIMVEESNSSNPPVINNNNNYDVQLTLRKLKVLRLSSLPQLKRICCRRGVMICDFLQHLVVFGCEKLQRIPLSLPLLENGEPSPPPSLKEIWLEPKEQWESLEWDQPNTKNVLQQFNPLFAN